MRLDDTALLGMAPVLPWYPAALQADGVRGVVNLCAEWGGQPVRLLSHFGVRKCFGVLALRTFWCAIRLRDYASPGVE